MSIRGRGWRRSPAPLSVHDRQALVLGIIGSVIGYVSLRALGLARREGSLGLGRESGDEPASPPGEHESAAPAPQPKPTLRTAYGAHPLTLLVLVASFALTGYVVLQVLPAPDTVRIAVWFVCAVIAHDLVLFPLYALADRSVHAIVRPRRLRTRPVVPVINYVRLPTMASGLLFLIFFPAILAKGTGTYLRASGQLEHDVYLDRWLLLTGAFFLLSALLYAVRAGRTKRVQRLPAGAA